MVVPQQVIGAVALVLELSLDNPLQPMDGLKGSGSGDCLPLPKTKRGPGGGGEGTKRGPGGGGEGSCEGSLQMESETNRLATSDRSTRSQTGPHSLAQVHTPSDRSTRPQTGPNALAQVHMPSDRSTCPQTGPHALAQVPRPLTHIGRLLKQSIGDPRADCCALPSLPHGGTYLPFGLHGAQRLRCVGRQGSEGGGGT